MKLYLSNISKNEIYKSELLVIITGIILSLGPLSKFNNRELRKKNFSAIYYKEDKIDIALSNEYSYNFEIIEQSAEKLLSDKKKYIKQYFNPAYSKISADALFELLVDHVDTIINTSNEFNPVEIINQIVLYFISIIKAIMLDKYLEDIKSENKTGLIPIVASKSNILFSDFEMIDKCLKNIKLGAFNYCDSIYIVTSDSNILIKLYKSIRLFESTIDLSMYRLRKGREYLYLEYIGSSNNKTPYYDIMIDTHNFIGNKIQSLVE